jgi:MarR family transcriptional regulator, organic hydroperoxide resistance regulator
MRKPESGETQALKNALCEDPQDNPERRLTKLMKRILIHLRASMDEKLRPYGVTTAQIRILAAISAAPGSSGAELARHCEITPQTTQVFLQRAEQAGWIVRSKDAVNDRILIASLTPEGEKLLKTSDRILRSIERRLWTGIPPRSIATLTSLLEHCLSNIS